MSGAGQRGPGRPKGSPNKPKHRPANESERLDRTPESRVSPEEKAQETRPERVPIGTHRDKLVARNIPDGYVGRFVNDTDNNVERYVQAGYQFVTDTKVLIGQKTVDADRGVGSTIWKTVGTKKDGTPLIAYLMVQRQDWYEQDQIAKQKEIDNTMGELKQRELDEGLEHKDSHFVGSDSKRLGYV